MSKATERGEQLLRVLSQPLAPELWDALGLRIGDPDDRLLDMLTMSGTCSNMEQVVELTKASFHVVRRPFSNHNFCLLADRGYGRPETYALFVAMAAISSGLVETACVYRGTTAKGYTTAWAEIPCPGTWEADRETEVSDCAIDIYGDLINQDNSEGMSDNVAALPLAINLDMIWLQIIVGRGYPLTLEESLEWLAKFAPGPDTFAAAVKVELACAKLDTINSALAVELLDVMSSKLPYLLPEITRLFLDSYAGETPLDALLVKKGWSSQQCQCGLEGCADQMVIGHREVVETHVPEHHRAIHLVERGKLLTLAARLQPPSSS